MISKKKQKTSKSIKNYLPIIANIYPIFAVIFLDWKIFEVLFVYFSETIIFLYLSLIKIYYLKIPNNEKIGQTFLYIFGLGIFYVFTGAVLLLYYVAEVEKVNPNSQISEIIQLIFNKSYFSGLLIFILTYLYEIYTFVKKKDYLNTTKQKITKIPALRIWILLMLVLVGVFLLKTTSIYLLIIFLTVKTGLDFILMKKMKHI